MHVQVARREMSVRPRQGAAEGTSLGRLILCVCWAVGSPDIHASVFGKVFLEEVSV